MAQQKPFAKTGGTKILVATFAAFALIFVMTTQPLKLRDKPPSWKISNERYGIGFQLLFGKSARQTMMACCFEGEDKVDAAQRSSFGPFYYERRLSTTMSGRLAINQQQVDEQEKEYQRFFAELQ